MITLDGITKTLGPRRLFDGLSASIAPGECVALVGPSGSGKSTLLRCLNALDSFDAGQASIAGHSLAPRSASRPARELVPLRTAVGMVFQEHHLFPHLTIADNVALAPRVVQKLSAEKARERALTLLSRVGLADRADAFPAELSGGQKQRVAIVRALAPDPKVLLLDEPTSALDPDTARDVLAAIRDVTRGEVTLVLVTHQLALASSLVTRTLRLEGGKLLG